MIKKFIDKLLGGGAKPKFGKRQEVGHEQHGIDAALVDERALNVVHTLKEAGFEAYIVGGAVRDLILGLRPKDFDIATNELVTRPIAAAFGVPELIAVELERDASGWITGEIAGTPSARDGKVVRATQWLAARGWDWLDVETTFYSDSTNDLPLLERVDHPVATNPDARLRTLALERGWRILDLFEKK